METTNQAVDSFELLMGQKLKMVFEKKVDSLLEEILFEFEQTSIIVVANSDDDTVDYKIKTTKVNTDSIYIDATNMNPWCNYIGRKFLWGWTITNQQGYMDGILLSFDFIFPSLLLNVIGSSINVGVIVLVNNQE